LVENIASAVAPRVAVPRVEDPSKKVTVPAVTGWPYTDTTSAERETARMRVEGFGVVCRVVAVAARVTT
jgi:hypothetical protein